MYTEYMYKDSLAHHGILGQKWGVRRYQNPDGTLTPEGRARYGIKSTDSSVTKRVKTDLANKTESDFHKKYHISKSEYMKRLDKYGDPYKNKSVRDKFAKKDYKSTKRDLKKEYKENLKSMSEKDAKETYLDNKRDAKYKKWDILNDYDEVDRSSLTKKQNKRRIDVDLGNYGLELSNKYIKTPKGKAKYEAYKKAMDKLEALSKGDDYRAYDKYGKNDFSKIEKDFLYDRCKYEAKHILDKYGKEDFASYIGASNTKSVDQLIKEYAEKYWWVHTM